MGTDSNRSDGALIPAEQDTITFYGHDLIAVRLADRRIATVLRWLCEGLQLDPQGQLRRIERKTALLDGLIDVEVETAGGPQMMPALTLQVLCGASCSWLMKTGQKKKRVQTSSCFSANA